jgi:hypothetical protein
MAKPPARKREKRQQKPHFDPARMPPLQAESGCYRKLHPKSAGGFAFGGLSDA